MVDVGCQEERFCGVFEDLGGVGIVVALCGSRRRGKDDSDGGEGCRAEQIHGLSPLHGRWERGWAFDLAYVIPVRNVG